MIQPNSSITIIEILITKITSTIVKIMLRCVIQTRMFTSMLILLFKLYLLPVLFF